MKNANKIILVFTVVLTLLTIVNVASAGILNRSLEVPPQYPINENGLTYGSGADAISEETEPDLISAVLRVMLMQKISGEKCQKPLRKPLQ